MAGSSSRGSSSGNSSTACNKLAKRCENSFPCLLLSLWLCSLAIYSISYGLEAINLHFITAAKAAFATGHFHGALQALLLLLTMVTQLDRLGAGSRWGSRLCPTIATTMMPTHTQVDSLPHTHTHSLSPLSLSLVACNMSSRCECCKRQCTLIAHCQIGACLQAEIR